jgi:hypothetical protein
MESRLQFDPHPRPSPESGERQRMRVRGNRLKFQCQYKGDFMDLKKRLRED